MRVLVPSSAEDGGSTIMTKEEVDTTLAQGLAALAEGRAISYIIFRGDPDKVMQIELNP